MGVEKIADADLNGKGNIGKADTPGVTLSEMQRIMDEIPREVLVPKINAIIDDVNLKSVRAETYTKTETDTAINNKMIAIGAGDMAKSVYDPDGDGIVDDAEKLGGVLPNGYATAAQGAEADALVSGTTPAGNATKFGGALPAAYATAAQGAKADVLKAGAVFAAAETATGELWEDASGNKYPVYRRVYHNVPVSDTANATTNITTGLASSYVRTMLGLGAKSYMARSNGAHVPINIYNTASTAWGGNNMVSLTIDSGTSTWFFQTVSSGAETGRTCELVVEYTKASDSAVT